jgi:predicted RNase H-like HicB family nuclease
MRVVYPVLFYEENDGKYSVFVPDLDNVSTCGDTLDEAMYMAQDLIAGVILDKMEEGSKLPKASDLEQIKYKDLEDWLDNKDWNYKSRFKTYIMVDLASFAEKWNKKLVKKTVNIPMWINSMAEELNVNFSKTLEEALLEKIYK